MPGVLSPDETLFVDRERVSIMGRNSQLVAAAVVALHFRELEWRGTWKEQGRNPRLTAIGDVGLALLRMEADLPPQATLRTPPTDHEPYGRERRFDLREELFEVGIPTKYLRLEFALSDGPTTSRDYDDMQRHITERVHRYFRRLSYYEPTEGHTEFYGSSVLRVPRVVRGPPHEHVVSPRLEVPPVVWSAPIVDHTLLLEPRPPADAGLLVAYNIDVRPFGPYHQQSVPLRGFNASALLVIALRKIQHIHTELPRILQDEVRNHQLQYLAAQSFLILLLYETEQQALLHAHDLAPNRTEFRHLAAQQQRDLVQIWEEKCSLDDAPHFAFDLLVHGAPDELEEDLKRYDELRRWILTRFDPRVDKEDAAADWEKSAGGRFAVARLNELSRWWPSLQAQNEVREGEELGPRKTAVARRMEVAFERVWRLFKRAPSDVFLQRRHAAVEGHSSRGEGELHE